MSRAEHHRRARRQDGAGDAADLHALHLAHDGTAQARACGAPLIEASEPRRPLPTTRRRRARDAACANALRALAIDAVRAGQVRPPRRADGHGRDGRRCCGRRHLQPQPGRPALARPRPLRALQRPRARCCCTRCCT
ncbi:MAG: hypothetical protein MZW92_57665 [Comamonadaceae bacterium]|nr:hypothetical protein [Comamonadaceae bacterium]